MLNLSKALDISKATARVAPNLLKALVILSDTTVRRSAVDTEDLKPYWKSEKRLHFFYVINNPIIYMFSKTLLITERKLTGWQFLQGPPMRPSNNLKNKASLDTY